MVDWLEFSVFDLSLDEVMAILDLKQFKFEECRSRWYRYSINYAGIISISNGFYGDTKDLRSKNHVHIKLTGKGCRFLENHYNTTDIRHEMLARLCSFCGDEGQTSSILTSKNIEIKVSRMDICIDYDSKFVVPIFEESIRSKSYLGFKTWNCAGNYDNGMTYYLGSRQSEKFFRMYEKDLESGDSKYKDRLELVLKDVYATAEFQNENEIIKIISSYMNDIEWCNARVQEVWDLMKSGECEISPKIRHKKTTLKEKAEYVLSTYGRTLKAYAEIYGTKDITQAIHEAVLSPKDLRMVENEKVIKLMKYRNKLAQRREIAIENAILESYKNGTSTYEQLKMSM